MEKSILFSLMFFMSHIFSAQKIRTEVVRDDFGKGNIVWIETWEKINHDTEAYKMTSYDPHSKNDGITGITTYTLVKGKKEGRYEELDGYGKDNLYVKSYSNYSNGKRQGKAAYFHDKNKLYYEENYVNDKVEGEVIYYHFDGTIRSKGLYKNGEKDGEWTNYYWGTDKVSSQGSYKNGKREGIWNSYFEDGRKEPEIKYANGQIDETYKSTAGNTYVNPWRQLRGLCLYVGSYIEHEEPRGRYIYTYQIKILDAAKVNTEKDSESQIAHKVSELWKEYEDKLVCNNTTFDVVNGNLIKYAVSQGDDHFIFDVVQWKINLNRVDEFDGKTVLDYTQDKIKEFEGTSLERRFKSYYISLKSAGAKHKSEL